VDSKTIRILILWGIDWWNNGKIADSIRRRRKFKRSLREWDGLI
jgi:hypothetical protein